jgi:adenosylcobyric acid synthase
MSGDTQPLARTLMVQGTSSDVGKSIVTTALCRIFTEDGYRVRPFKSQNMSLNSYVTPDGREIGRAQGVQADACQVPATTDMNPILLKPKQDMVAQVVVHGKPLADFDARTYRESYLPQAERIVQDALARLRAVADIVVLEGAGSPAEVNLKDRDIVNMRAAAWADSPVLLVADIDRGGVFASIVGTLEILTSEERARVQGFIINKFRGDVSLLQPGLDWLEAKTGKPVLGVIPYLPELGIEDEDSASLDSKRRPGIGASGRTSVGATSAFAGNEPADDTSPSLDIVVLRLPRISNFTDIDPLLLEPDVRVRFVSHPAEWGDPDAVVLPGSKNTIDDLIFVREQGLASLLIDHVKQRRRFLIGICAGYQMLGERLFDPERFESDRTAELDGLGLLPTVTRFTADKRTMQVSGVTTLYTDEEGRPLPIEGYEIHMGRTRYSDAPDASAPPPFRIADGGGAPRPDGAAACDSRVWGTYVHGILHNDELRRAWLNELRAHRGLTPLPVQLRFRERRERAFTRLAAHVRDHLALDRIYEMMGLSGLKNGNGEGDRV